MSEQSDFSVILCKKSDHLAPEGAGKVRILKKALPCKCGKEPEFTHWTINKFAEIQCRTCKIKIVCHELDMVSSYEKLTQAWNDKMSEQNNLIGGAGSGPEPITEYYDKPRLDMSEYEEIICVHSGKGVGGARSVRTDREILQEQINELRLMVEAHAVKIERMEIKRALGTATLVDTISEIKDKVREHDQNLEGLNRAKDAYSRLIAGTFDNGPRNANPNSGHGHVFPRPDGVMARCGGPGICIECVLDKVRADNAKV